MWTRQFFGVESYYIIQWFFFYSIMGWCVESIYMSLCNKKLTNRGFVKGPFCPIYGFGALGAYFLLRPYAENYLILYLLGAVLATVFEYLVGILMKQMFGQIWWDYNSKPFNYKGILCLESTVAWGFYTLFLFGFLHSIAENVVNSYSMKQGIFMVKIAAFIFLIDLLHTLYEVKKEELPYTLEDLKEVLTGWK